MMGWSHFHQFCVIVVVSLTLLAGISASASISDGIFWGDALTGRSLLQVKKSCPVNFEIQNYTIITSQCKPPDYPPNLCCPAFKQFACPFVEQVNDLTTECASSMFRYITLRGYRSGLFPTICGQGKDGIKCLAQPPSDADNTNGNLMTSKPSSSVHILAAAFLVLLLRLL